MYRVAGFFLKKNNLEMFVYYVQRRKRDANSGFHIRDNASTELFFPHFAHRFLSEQCEGGTRKFELKKSLKIDILRDSACKFLFRPRLPRDLR